MCEAGLALADSYESIALICQLSPLIQLIIIIMCSGVWMCAHVAVDALCIPLNLYQARLSNGLCCCNLIWLNTECNNA